MSDITLDPYLFFQGNAREAMEFYKSTFGGELTMQTMGEVPEGAEERKMITEENKHQIMHAALRSGGITLYGSDSPKASVKAAKVELSLGGSDEKRLTEIFNKLADGGKAGMPLAKQFWGDTFGMVTDKFGVDWMVNITRPSSK